MARKPPPLPELPECASIDQVATRLGVSPWTLRTWCREGKLPYFKIGKRILLQIRDVERLLAESYQPALRGPLVDTSIDPFGGR